MLVGGAGAGSERLKSIHLILLVFKSRWRPRKECCMALNLVWRLDSTVSKEGPEAFFERSMLISDGEEVTFKE